MDDYNDGYDYNEYHWSTYIIVFVLAILMFKFMTSDLAIKLLDTKKPRKENPYLRKLPPREDPPAAKPKKRIRVEPDEGPTLGDIEDEVYINGDDDLEYYDYILR